MTAVRTPCPLWGNTIMPAVMGSWRSLVVCLSSLPKPGFARERERQTERQRERETSAQHESHEMLPSSGPHWLNLFQNCRKTMFYSWRL